MLRALLIAGIPLLVATAGCMHRVKNAPADVGAETATEGLVDTVADAHDDVPGDALPDLDVAKDVPDKDVDAEAKDALLDVAEPRPEHLDVPDGEATVPDGVEPASETVEQVDAPDGEVCPAEPCLPEEHPDLEATSCQVLVWDALTCSCVPTPRDLGTPCDDGDRCTLEDACDADGGCKGVVPDGACDDGNPCTVDACDTVLGCVFTDTVGGCDDKNPCSLDDRCEGGECVGTPDPRLMDWGCDCELEAAEYCEQQFTDGDRCNGDLACVAHVCLVDFATKPRCPVAEPGGCTEHVCNGVTGACDAKALEEDTPCSDGDPCTIDDACQAGECVGTLDYEAPDCVCSEGNDRCEELLGDGDLCNGVLHCQAGACTLDAEAVVGPCDMSGDTPCTKNLCNPITGTCASQALQDGTRCEDGNACTFGETCQAQVCQGGTTRTCGELDSACGSWTCDETTGQCVPSPTPTISCVDYIDPPTNSVPDLCTRNYCDPVAGECIPPVPRSCVDADACTTDSCIPATGQCQHLLKATGEHDNCDSVDNDCDGATDEDFVADTACFLPGACAAGNLASACQSGVEKPCQTGTPATDDATCDAIDDDCDDATDEDYAPATTACGAGACASSGQMACVRGAETDSCVPGQPAADDATCDAVDDDCDGTNDEDYVPLTTTCGKGECAASGQTTCASGTEGDTCLAGTPGTETCNGQDDDCDDTTDNGAVLCPLGEECKGAEGCKCAPDCAGRICGDDGCLGVCGECAAGQDCIAGACEDRLCSDVPLRAPSFESLCDWAESDHGPGCSGDATAIWGSDHNAASHMPTDGSYWLQVDADAGACGIPESFEYQANVDLSGYTTMVFDYSEDAENYGQGIVRAEIWHGTTLLWSREPLDPSGQNGDDTWELHREESVDLPPGLGVATLAIKLISTGDAGTFAVDNFRFVACAPDCAGRVCGDDGCGGSCGPCEPNQACDPNGNCATPGFVKIPAGSFWMGSPGGEACPVGYTGGGCTGDGSGTSVAELGRDTDETLHYVQLTTAFELQAMEVTQGEWKALLGGWNPSYFPACGDTCPVEQVNWYEVAAYANAKSVAAGKTACYSFAAVTCRQNGNPGDATNYGFCMDATHAGITSATVTLNGVATPYSCTGFRLPTESEWEYAYRVGSSTAFYPSAGNDGTITKTDCSLDENLDQIGWYCGNDSTTTKPGGGKEANAWGLYDMTGNVWEWCWDLHPGFAPYYPTGTAASPVMDPTGATTGTSPVFRGGAWAYDAGNARASNRGENAAGNRDSYLGARLARSLPAGTDSDADGDPDFSDCAPNDKTVFHGAPEACNSVDDNCDSQKDEGTDLCPAGQACVTGSCITDGFVKIPAGSFWMGSPAGGGETCPMGYTGGGCQGDGSGTTEAELGRSPAEALHYVQLTKPFEIQSAEVTQGEWKSLFGSWNPSHFNGCGDYCPLENVTWYDALAFANAKSVAEGLPLCYIMAGIKCWNGDSADCMLSTRGGIKSASVSLNGVATPYACKGYRLPTESEWEYAYRAGGLTAFYAAEGSDGGISVYANECSTDPNLDKIGWYCGNASGTAMVGKRAPNEWGLFDMAGNVDEWSWDWYGTYPEGSFDMPAKDPTGATESPAKILRGGSWTLYARFGRGASRGVISIPENRDNDFGFRLTRTLAAGKDSDHDGDADVTDCAPNDDAVFYGAIEVCNGVDDDCDSTIDNGGDNLCVPGEACLGAAGCLCAPDCSIKVCGDDGCGGSCGACSANQLCDPNGNCATPGFVKILAGSFWMGSPGGESCPVGYTGGECTGDGSGTAAADLGHSQDQTLHYVQLTTAFEIQAKELTQAEWKGTFGAWNPSGFTACGDTCPVEWVSWYDVIAYANATSVASGLTPCYVLAGIACEDGTSVAAPADCMTSTRGGIDTATVTLNGVATPYSCTGFRLPTESEWEYAYRAGGVTAFHTSAGNDGTLTKTDCSVDANLTQIGWYCGNALGTLHVGGGLEANPWGLYDVAGNVWEWCWDVYGTYPTGTVASPAKDPQKDAVGQNRLTRGGSWDNDAKHARAATRSFDAPGYRNHYLGARLARSLPADCPTGTAIVDNGDGTVTDPATCYVWQRTPPSPLSWTDANAYCDGNQAGLPGTSWRLPTISELRSLIRGCPGTVTDGTCGVADSCMASSCWSDPCDGCSLGSGPAGGCYWDANLQGDCTWFWASASTVGYPNHEWGVQFANGRVDHTDVVNGREVRCVRSGP